LKIWTQTLSIDLSALLKIKMHPGGAYAPRWERLV